MLKMIFEVEICNCSALHIIILGLWMVYCDYKFSPLKKLRKRKIITTLQSIKMPLLIRETFRKIGKGFVKAVKCFLKWLIKTVGTIIVQEIVKEIVELIKGIFHM